MASLINVKSVWDTLSEIDLAPLREDALCGVRIALMGGSDSGRHSLAHQIRRDPSHPQMVTQSPLLLLEITELEKAIGTDLVIVIVDAGDRGDVQRQTAEELMNSSHNVLVFINHYAEVGDFYDSSAWVGWDQRRIVYGDVEDENTLLKSFVPSVMALLPNHLTALARDFPLFRVPVANHMINETCLSNAAYSFTTGLAEMVPVLGIPLNVADIIVLTKMQAFLVYKLGLALGYSTRWQDYVTEFGGVLGGSFLWRQMARTLVGLIPLYGIIPKVAIAYAGTYVVGQVVLRWYLTGKHLSQEEINALFKEAFQRGKQAASQLRRKRPEGRGRKIRLRLPGRKRLPANDEQSP